ncbi:MAG: hypothetical protein AAF298_23840 [Cyanobacteria bacterium P01_A01_bin.40]
MNASLVVHAANQIAFVWQGTVHNMTQAKSKVAIWHELYFVSFENEIAINHNASKTLSSRQVYLA